MSALPLPSPLPPNPPFVRSSVRSSAFIRYRLAFDCSAVTFYFQQHAPRRRPFTSESNYESPFVFAICTKSYVRENADRRISCIELSKTSTLLFLRARKCTEVAVHFCSVLYDFFQLHACMRVMIFIETRLAKFELFDRSYPIAFIYLFFSSCSFS